MGWQILNPLTTTESSACDTIKASVSVTRQNYIRVSHRGGDVTLNVNGSECSMKPHHAMAIAKSLKAMAIDAAIAATEPQKPKPKRSKKPVAKKAARRKSKSKT